MRNGSQNKLSATSSLVVWQVYEFGPTRFMLCWNKLL